MAAQPVADAAFLAANPGFLADQQRWFTYNNRPNAVVPANAAIIANWRTTPFVRGLLPMANYIPPARPAPSDLVIVPETAAQQAQRLLDEPVNIRPRFAPRGLGKRATNWKGVKILGSGANAVASLWEWSGSATTKPTTDHLQIVVKLNTDQNFAFDLEDEGDMMMSLKNVPSKHIVKILAPPKALSRRDCARERLAVANWQGKVKRLVMEYCSKGSLQQLKANRSARDLPFKELTLWRVFDCLVDGCSALTFKQELDVDRRGQALPPARPSAEVVVHFDLKPANIFVGETDRKHSGSPVFKIGDFGLAEKVDSNPANVVPSDDYDIDQEYRLRGTPGWYAPEQFTPRWEHNDFLTSPVCGRYGTATNVWGIGTLMYQVSDTSWDLIITGMDYSNTLRKLILECLYEVPADRPALADLKTRIRAAIALLEMRGAAEDKWYDLELPDQPAVDAYNTDETIAREAAGLPPLRVTGNRQGRFRRATLRARRHRYM
ncbi:hypothetical protein IFR04_004362 [Cadophora malorum]|uniref:non-specific serine/threonine protein kinase n=1 Tax=Cadophora malorum TaxID=108018 RepID=A0A8H7WCU2_9HELO|nr:hypothetical protein IFR04_004362 [Cadophora malorum]